MSDTMWTPGPWHLTATEDGAFCIEAPVGRPDNMEAVICDRGPWRHRAEMSTSNGLLIAAAPDLYAALERLTGCVRGLGKRPVRDLDEAMEEARAALARARGTSQEAR